MKNIVWILVFISFQTFGQRSIVLLNGTWEIEESIKPYAVPRKFNHSVVVPGLVNQSVPGFVNVDKFTTLDVIRHPIVGIKDNPLLDTIRIGIVGQNRNFFWYRRNFELRDKREIVVLKISKAQFGTQVWINGKNAGDHFGCFTAGYFDITKYVKQPGRNEIVIRIGAHPKALPEWVPFGTDLEKRKWTPGIYDDVTVIACNNPYIETLQVAPDINTSRVKVQTKVINYLMDGIFTLEYTVKEWKGGKKVASATKKINLTKNEAALVDNLIDIPDEHLWSPNDPFLYELEASTGGDNFNCRFGMREFHYDTKTKLAYLNNKVIFLRGSNICLHRFFEDSLCLDNPWNEKWVRRLLFDIPKEMNWNSFRFCIGPAPDKWFEIADEAGLLIQNEFFLWTQKDYWKIEELENQLGEWMRDHWNHPSVVIWDMQNETRWDRLEGIINKYRSLDLSNRQWENGWSKTAGENDPSEDHNYISYSDKEGGKISQWRMPAYTPQNAARSKNSFNPTAHASVLNEYAWLWLHRDGKPTILSEDFYNTVAPDLSDQQRMDLYGYLIAGETEYFRAFRNYAAIHFFSFLTADFPTAFTGDLFQDIQNLILNPVYEGYMKEAFKPLGVYLDFWMGEIRVNSEPKGRFPVILINDEYINLKGRLEIRIEEPNGKLVTMAEKPFEISALIADTYLIDCEFPKEPGEYVVKAIAHPENYTPTTTTSIRKLKMLP
jgi:beta-galactosidase